MYCSAVQIHVTLVRYLLRGGMGTVVFLLGQHNYERMARGNSRTKILGLDIRSLFASPYEVAAACWRFTTGTLTKGASLITVLNIIAATPQCEHISKKIETITVVAQGTELL
jgi:hypothetical protein